MNKTLDTTLSVGLSKAQSGESVAILAGVIREDLYEEMKFDLSSKG